MQIKVERRYNRGLYLLNSFTYSRARDNASGHLEVQNGDNSRVNYRDLDAEFGRSGYDQPLNNTTSVVWELPFGKGRKLSLIHLSEPTRQAEISYAVFCLKKKNYTNIF